MGPTCSIFFEREPMERDIMRRSGRPQGASLFHGRELAITLALGLSVAGGLLGLYYYFMQEGYTLPYTRTIVFLTLVCDNILLTFAGRSFTETLKTSLHHRNSLAIPILVISIMFICLIYFVPFASRLFGLTGITFTHVLIAGSVSLVSTGWFELYKYLHAGRRQA